MSVDNAAVQTPAAPSPKPIVLISYDHRDENFALQLFEELEKKHFAAWIDKVEIAAGTDFTDSIETGIKGCTHVVVILSSVSLESEWVNSEIHYAKAQGKKVLPVIIEAFDISKIPLILAGKKYIDFRASSFDDCVATLVASILDEMTTTRTSRTRLWFRRHKAIVASVSAALLTLVLIALIPPSETSGTLIQTGEPKVVKLHMENRGWWPSTVTGYRLKFGDLPIANANLDLASPHASTIVPRHSALDLYLVKHSGFNSKLTADQIAPLIRGRTITLEIDVKESNDPARNRPVHVRTTVLRAESIWRFLEAGLSTIFLGGAHVA